MTAGKHQQQTIDMGASMETEQALSIIDALNEVSDVSAMAGSLVTFAGEAVAALGPHGRLQGIDVYSCPRGSFMLFRERRGPHWSTAGRDVRAAVDAVHEGEVRAALERELRQMNLL